MKAWVMESFGAPEVLELTDVPTPTPGPTEVRIRVEAIAVARTKDVSLRAGRPPFAPRVVLPHIPGTEHAGVVDLVGPEVSLELVGTRVAVSAVLSCGDCSACSRGHEEACSSFALVGVDQQGCYAEYVIVPAGNVHSVPDDLSFAQAAALAANGPVARAAAGRRRRRTRIRRRGHGCRRCVGFDGCLPGSLPRSEGDRR